MKDNKITITEIVHQQGHFFKDVGQKELIKDTTEKLFKIMHDAVNDSRIKSQQDIFDFVSTILFRFNIEALSGLDEKIGDKDATAINNVVDSLFFDIKSHIALHRNDESDESEDQLMDEQPNAPSMRLG